MEIFVNLTDLEELNLTPSLYCYLATLYYKQEYNVVSENLKRHMDTKLEQLGYLKVTEEGPVLRSKCDTMFKKGVPSEESVDEWIEEWRDLFPKGVKSGNRPVRGDRKGVYTKMKVFVKNNPKVTKEQIIDATRQYVFDANLKSYQYMICADYFISKNGSSMLGAMIEDVEDRGSTLRNTESGGGSSWHREI
jgi:hypothetical protein